MQKTPDGKVIEKHDPCSVYSPLDCGACVKLRPDTEDQPQCCALCVRTEKRCLRRAPYGKRLCGQHAKICGALHGKIKHQEDKLLHHSSVLQRTIFRKATEHEHYHLKRRDSLEEDFGKFKKRLARLIDLRTQETDLCYRFCADRGHPERIERLENLFRQL